jgi:hypothetical protein
VIALFAIATMLFALANNAAAVHKDPAFQASSPKTFSCPSGRLFFALCSEAQPAFNRIEGKSGPQLGKYLARVRTNSGVHLLHFGRIY